MAEPRVFLRKVDVSDAGLIARWYNDRKNIKYMNPIIRCKSHSAESMEHELKSSMPEREQLFMVCLKEDGRPIGHAGIDDIEMDDRRGEIFFLIGERGEQGKGYGKEIAKQLLDHAFAEMHFNTLFATVTVENAASVAVLEKVGFRKIGVRREYNFIDGKYLDEVFLDITFSDYLSLRAAEGPVQVGETAIQAAAPELGHHLKIEIQEQPLEAK